MFVGGLSCVEVIEQDVALGEGPVGGAALFGVVVFEFVECEGRRANRLLAVPGLGCMAGLLDV